jgi:hypothetical protein
MEDKKGLKVIAHKEMDSNPELYKLVDFLNKNLKEKNVIFGLAMKDEKMTVTIYNT